MRILRALRVLLGLDRPEREGGREGDRETGREDEGWREGGRESKKMRR